MESEFEKVDRLMELYVKYEAQVAAAESTFRQQLQGTHARGYMYERRQGSAHTGAHSVCRKRSWGLDVRRAK